MTSIYVAKEDTFDAFSVKQASTFVPLSCFSTTIETLYNDVSLNAASTPTSSGAS